MLLDDGSGESSFLCLRRLLFLSHFFFFDDESENDGSRYGSSGTCAFPFFSGNSVDRFNGLGSGVFVLTGINSTGDFFRWSCSYQYESIPKLVDS